MQRSTADVFGRTTIALALMVSALVIGAPAVLAAAPPNSENLAPQAADGVAAVSSSTSTTVATSTSSEGAALVSLDPVRLLESRVGSGYSTVDGEFEGDGPLVGGSVRRVQVAGRGGVPEGAAAAVLNVTVVNPVGDGYVVLYSCAGEPPESSSLNLVSGGAVANEVIVKLSASGEVCAFGPTTTDLLVDATGYVPEGAALVSLDPVRLLESRVGSGYSTVDGEFEGDGPLVGGSVRRVQVAGRGGVPEGAAAAVLNVTVVNPVGDGYVVLYSCAGEPPESSSLNLVSGGAVANEVIVKLSASGEVCAFGPTTTDLLVDATGYVPEGAALVSLDPVRLLESRVGSGYSTVDGEFEGDGPLVGGSVRRVQVAGRGGVPEGAAAAVLNVTVVNPVGDGYVVLYSCAGEPPESSSLNLVSGGAVANEVIVKLSASGEVCAFGPTTTDLLVDATGYVPGGSAETGGALPGTTGGGEGPGTTGGGEGSGTTGGGLPEGPLAEGSGLLKGLETGWHVVPGELAFFEPDGDQVATLVHIGPDGQPSGQALPAGVTIEGLGDDIFDVSRSGTTIDVSAGSEVGTQIVAVKIPGQPEAIPLWLNAARLRPDVTVLPSYYVQFPREVGAIGNGIAPFTRAEVEARVAQVAGEFVDPVNPEGHLPYIIDGDAPAVGTLVLASDMRSILGRVIAPPGLPTIDRDGRSLITVELVPLNEIFDELEVDLDYEEMGELGLAPNFDYVYECPEATPADECPDPDGASPIGLQRSASTFGAIAAPLVAQAEEEDPPCATSFGAGVTDFKMLEMKNSIGPIGKIRAVLHGDDLYKIWLEVGFGGAFEAGMSMKLQGSIGIEIECTFKEFGRAKLPMYPPLRPFLALDIQPAIAGKIGITMSGGPKIEFGAKCGVEFAYTVGMEVNFYTGDFVPTQRTEHPSPTCETKLGDYTPGSNDGVPAISVEPSAAAVLQLPIAARIGGDSAEWLGEFLEVPDLGRGDLFTLEVGPQLKLKWENEPATVVNAKNETGVGLFIVGALGLAFDPLETLFKKLGVPISLTFSLVEVSREIGRLFGAYNAKNPVQVKVAGELVTGTPVPLAEAGDLVEIESSVVEEAGGVTELSNADVTAARVLMKQDDGNYKDFGRFTMSTERSGANAFSVTGQLTLSRTDCAKIGEDPRDFMIVADQEFGLVPFTGFGGKFQLRCDGAVDFDPLLTKLSKSTKVKTITLRQRNFDGSAYSIFKDRPEPRISLSNGEGTFAGPAVGGDGSEYIDLEVTLICGDDTDDIAPLKFTITVDGNIVDGKEFVVDGDCSDSAFDIVESEVEAGAPIRFDTRGPTDDAWFEDSPYIVDDVSAPVPAFLPGDDTESTQAAVVSALTTDPREAIPIPSLCGTPGALPLPAQTVTEEIKTTDRGSDTVKINLPARDGKPKVRRDCSKPAGSKGDPHIASFDGVDWDAQVLGEYLYGETEDGSTRIVGRFERASSGEANPFKPTSTTAIAFEVEGHLIEAYARSFRLYVDGVDYDLPHGLAFDVGDGVSVTRTPAGANIVTPDLSVEITTFAAPEWGILQGLNVDIYTQGDGALTGMLGTNDGDPSNDLTLSTGESISLEEALAHDLELYSLTDSWRLTDRDESPFSIQYAGFDDANEPRPGSETLAPFRQAALDLLGGVSDVCAGEFEDGARIIDVLAIELAIGRPPADLGDVTCGYRVFGHVMLDDPQIPALGSTVVVDAPGMASCETVVDSNGNYACTMQPDVAELNAGAVVSYPLPVSVEVTAAGATTVGATASDTFAGPPVFGDVASRRLDVVLPAATATTIVLDGTLTEYGMPFTSRGAFRIEGLDANGDLALATTRHFDPTSTGEYAEVIAIPLLSTMTITWLVGDGTASRPVANVADLTSGPNPRTVDFDFSPQTLDLSGELRFNGVVPWYQTVSVAADLADGTTWTLDRGVFPDVDSGAYDLRVVLPDNAETATVSTRFGDRRNAPVSLDVPTITGGLNTVTFDAVFTAPVLDLSGTASVNGVPVDDVVQVIVDVTRSDGSELRLSQRRPVTPTGEYAWRVDLVDDAVSVDVRLGLGAIDADDPVRAVPTIVDGLNVVEFTADHETPRIDVAGTVSTAGVPYTDSVTFAVSTTEPEAFSTNVIAQPDGDGAYSFSANLPVGTTDADITARIGVSPVLTVSTSVDNLVDGGNAVDFEAVVDAIVLRLTGRFTERTVPVADDDVRISIRRFDAAGTLIQRTSRTAETDANGDYALDVFLDDDTASVELAGVLGPNNDDRGYQRFDALEVINPLTFDDDYNPPILDVTGVFTAGGVPLAGRQTIVAVSTVDLPDGGSTTRTQHARPTVNLSDGSYAHEIITPDTTTDVELEARIGPDPDDYPTLSVPDVEPGSNPVTFSADLPLPVFVDFYADLDDADGPYSGRAFFDVRGYDADDVEVMTSSINGTADAIGKFYLPLIYDQTLRRIEIDWTIGISADPPITRSYDVAPGANTVVFTGTHDSAVLELGGVATLNGDPFGERFDLAVSVVRDGGAAWETTARVVPNATTGVYSSDVTLPRDAESATVIAHVTAPLGTDPRIELPTLEAGANTVSFDPAFVGPRLDVTGVMFNGDEPPPADVVVAVTADADGRDPITFDVVVNPHDTTGVYALAALLPTWATSATLVAQIGPDQSDWPTHVVNPLTATTVPIEFDAVVADQALSISGTLSVGGQPWTQPVRVNISGKTAEGGNFGGRSVVVEPDSNGQYSSTFVPSVDLAEVTLSVVLQTTPFDHPQQRFETLTSGVNYLGFDVAFEGRAVAVTGRFTKDGVPVVGNRDLSMRAFVGTTTTPALVRTVGVVTDADGNYEAPWFLVPANATEVQFSTQFGEFERDGVVQRTDGLGDGVNAVVFDDNYVVPSVALTGTLQRDGEAITEPVTFGIEWAVPYAVGNGTSAEVRVFTVTPDASGDYTLDAVGPRGATAARIIARIGDFVEHYPATSIEPLGLGVNTSQFDVDYVTTSVSLAGTATYRGAPSPNKNVVITSYDANGVSLGNHNANLKPDPVTGAYTLDFDVPLASEDIVAVVRYGGDSDIYEQVQLDLDVTPGTTTSAEWEIITTSIEITGNVQGPGGAFVNESFGVEIIARQGSTELATISGLQSGSDSSGDYRLVAFLPAGTDNISFAPALAGVDPIAITGVTPGELDSVQDLTTTGGVAVSLSGLFIVDGHSPDDEPTITLIGYSLGEVDEFGPDEVEELSRVSVPHIYFNPANYAADGIVHLNSDLVSVEVAFPNATGPDTIYRRTFDVRDQTAPYDFWVEVRHDVERAELSGYAEVIRPGPGESTECGNEGRPFIWTATLLSFDGPVDAADTTETELFSTVVVNSGSEFDPDDVWDLVSHVPADSEVLMVYVETDEFYESGEVQTDYGYSFDSSSGAVAETSIFIDGVCTPFPI